MKCEQYLKLIYLYTELNSKEKRMVDQHLPTCDHCQLTFDSVVQQRVLIRSAFKGTQPLPDSSLTDKIMRSIEGDKPRKTVLTTGLIDLVQMSFVRYSLLVLSFFSVSFFVAETLNTSRVRADDMAASFKTPIKKNVILNSDLFYKSSRDSISSSPLHEGSGRLSIYECMRLCESQTDSDCVDCRKKFSKLAKI